MVDTDLRRLLLVTTITALCATALVAITALVVGDFDSTQLRILATTGGFGLVSLIATRGTALLEQRRHESLGRAVVGLSALAFLTELWAVWFDTDEDLSWKSFVCAIAAAGATGQIAGMLARQRATDPPSIQPLLWATAACAVLLALMAAFAALAEVDDAGYYQLFGAVAILNILGLLLQPVLRRLVGAPAAASSTRTFHVVLADGRRVAHDAADDLPNAVADALRRHGERAVRIELGDG